MILNLLSAQAEAYALSSAYNFQVPEFGTPEGVNIHDTLFQILELFLGLFKYCFEFLKSFEFLGTNLLSFTVTIFIVGAVFPIIFSLVSSRFVGAGARGESKHRANKQAEADRNFNPSDYM